MKIFKIRYLNQFILALLSLILIQCGGGSTNNEEGAGAISFQVGESKILEEAEYGDDLEWGKFIRDEFQTNTINKLPIEIYAVNFNQNELDEIKKGIEIANHALRYPVFELINKPKNDSRYIYKVKKIEFETTDRNDAIESFDQVIGYTYTRTVLHESYFNLGQNTARVVTDWAMELKEGRITKWVVAHELGHAVGIKQHQKINFENGELEELTNYDLMSANIPINPSINDFNYMMERQAEVLFDYLYENGVMVGSF
jgi:hypothetical protein